MENLKLPTVNRPIHEDKELCKNFLSKVETAITLNILPASIPGAGSGVFTSTDLAAGEEIFRVPGPLVSCTGNATTEFICDFCFYYEKSKVDPSGRFLTDNDQSRTVSVCNGCKLVRYCTKVSQDTPLTSHAFLLLRHLWMALLTKI